MWEVVAGLILLFVSTKLCILEAADTAWLRDIPHRGLIEFQYLQAGGHHNQVRVPHSEGWAVFS